MNSKCFKRLLGLIICVLKLQFGILPCLKKKRNSKFRVKTNKKIIENSNAHELNSSSYPMEMRWWPTDNLMSHNLQKQGWKLLKSALHRKKNIKIIHERRAIIECSIILYKINTYSSTFVLGSIWGAYYGGELVGATNPKARV